MAAKVHHVRLVYLGWHVEGEDGGEGEEEGAGEGEHDGVEQALPSCHGAHWSPGLGLGGAAPPDTKAALQLDWRPRRGGSPGHNRGLGFR